MQLRNDRPMLALSLIMVGIATMASCTATQPTPVPSPVVQLPSGCVVSGQNNNVNCGDGNQQITPPLPSPGTGTGGDNVVKGFAIFCYGFGTQPPQTEPNHEACTLPHGYPNIAVTASPKNQAGIDIPNPGDKTSESVVSWQFNATPANGASLNVSADNHFNATVVPADARVDVTFTAIAVYKDQQGNTWVASKQGGIKQ